MTSALKLMMVNLLACLLAVESGSNINCAEHCTFCASLILTPTKSYFRQAYKLLDSCHFSLRIKYIKASSF